MLTPFFFGGMPSRCYYFATIWGDFHKEPRPMAARLIPAQHRLFVLRADWRDAAQYPPASLRAPLHLVLGTSSAQ